MESENEMTETKVSENTAAAAEETENERILRVERERVIDVTLRYARHQGYCNVTNEFLARVYPSVTGGFYDSSGLNCDGHSREEVEAREAREAEERREYGERQRVRRAQRDLGRIADRGEHIATCWCGEVHASGVVAS
jgi:hypothetical protein